MINYYQTLFRIDLAHDYYRNGQCQSLSLSPSRECEARLRDQQLIFKPGTSGGMVIVTQKNTGTEASPVLQARVDIAANSIFTFKLTMNSNDFLNITDFEQDDFHPLHAYIFMNASSASESSDGSTRTVSVHEGKITQAPMPVVGKSFKHRIKQGANIAAIAVHDAAGSLLFQRPCSPGLEDIGIDMQAYPEGDYIIHDIDQNADSVASRHYFISDDYRSERLFGFVQIHYRANILAASEPVHAFKLRFLNRKIHWAYTINVREVGPLSPDNLNVDKLNLADAPTAFTRVVNNSPPKSIRFLSINKIPLREVPYRGIQLKNGSSDSAEVLIENLPNPLVKQLTRTGTSDWQSEMSLTIK